MIKDKLRQADKKVYTVLAKNVSRKFFATSSPNIDRFSKFFQGHIL